jgi:hypothetical protein
VTDFGTNSGLFNVSGIDWQVYYSADFSTNALTGGNDILVVVPEPSSLVALAGGFGLLMGLGRFRRREESMRSPCLS